VAHIASLDELRELYRAPSTLVRSKVRSSLDPMSEAFIAGSPFLLLATTGPGGRVDVSPRGGPAGFVRVLDGGRLAIPDLNGNNLLDSLENIVLTGRAATLFVRPGHDETLRVNGTATVVTDDDVLDGFVGELRRPKSAVIIEPDEVFIHCAKAFRRGGVWQPDQWQPDGPDAVSILTCQLSLDIDESDLRDQFEAGYASDLAAD